MNVSIGTNVVQSQRFEFAYRAGAVSGDREPDERVWRRGDGATLTHRAGRMAPERAWRTARRALWASLDRGRLVLWAVPALFIVFGTDGDSGRA